MSYASDDIVYHAISDRTRRDILRRLGRGALSAGQLADGFPVSRPAISKHVRVLREAGLVRERREGRNRIYELRAERLRVVDRWLEQYRGMWRTNLRSLKEFVESEQGD
jgi:DNA-binding transcriptional ArsR family regulator